MNADRADQPATPQPHLKHARLTRPRAGQWGRNEFALIGAPCGRLQALARTIAEGLAEHGLVAWLDADHSQSDASSPGKPFSGLAYTDRITHHELAWHGSADSYRLRPLLEQARLTLVNGNHFTAQQQVVVLDPRKFDSLSRKLDRLTQVRLLISTAEAPRPPHWLRPHLPKGIPTVADTDTAALLAFFRDELQRTTPPLWGLVLAGGKSTRMGEDKSLIAYHGKPQRAYLFELLQARCAEVYYSVRADQQGDFPSETPLLLDTFLGLGPFGAILSAFRHNPNAAWLVVACDLPLLDAATLDALIAHRQPGKVATAFRNPESDFPEPLIAIYEPPAYGRLLQFLAMGYACPRKMLINSPIALIEAPQPDALRNANTPEERAAIMALLKGKRPELP